MAFWGIAGISLALASIASGSDPIEGIWLGQVQAPQGTGADIGFRFYAAKNGRLTFRMNFPEMFTYDQSFGIPVETIGHGRYVITEDLDIELDLVGSRLSGTFGKGRLPMTLVRGEAFPPKPHAPAWPDPPSLLWQYEMGAGTWAAPVVADGVVYIGTSAGVFHAVCAGNGGALWKWRADCPIDSRAVVGDEMVYFLDTRTELIALGRKRGELVWKTQLYDEALAGAKQPENPTFNHRAATPLLLDGVLYCGSGDGGVYAIDATTGAKLWRHEAGAAVYSGIGQSGRNTLLFGTMDGSIVLLDRVAKRETLRVKTGGGVVTTPIVSGGRIIAGSRDYMLYGLNFPDGSVAWRFSYWFSWVESTPSVEDGLMYIGASDFARITALDPSNGRAKWSTPVGGMNWGTPLVTKTGVFTGTVSQNMERTVITHVGGLTALDRATGRPKWRLVATPAPEGAFGGYAGSLAIAGDKIIAAGFDGRLIALPAN